MYLNIPLSKCPVLKRIHNKSHLQVYPSVRVTTLAISLAVRGAPCFSSKWVTSLVLVSTSGILRHLMILSKEVGYFLD